jgi:hypothetical protein
MHKPANVRAAKRLGIKLGDGTASPTVKSHGTPPLTFGKGRITRFVYGPDSVGEYGVVLRGRTVGSFKTLDEAVGFAKWLGRKANRQAAKGVAPKEQRDRLYAEKLAESENAEEHREGMALLKAELSRLNGGAVTIR